MASKAKQAAVKPVEVEVEAPAVHPLTDLIRAALRDYRERLAADFRPCRGGEGPAPTGPAETWEAKGAVLRRVELVLHHLVLAAHGFDRGMCPTGRMAVAIDGALIVVDEEDGLEDGERVHVVERADVVAFV